MTNIDQFESVFKAAEKPPFTHEMVQIQRVLTVTDAESEATSAFVDQLQRFLQVLAQPTSAEASSAEASSAEGLSAEGPSTDATRAAAPPGPQWSQLSGQDFSTIHGLLEQLQTFRPDLICTYRNLFIPSTEFPYSLGVYVDVLTQATDVPILLLPRPDVTSQFDLSRPIQTVMAVTDHLAGDHHLVSFAARMTAENGCLMLSHVEDERTFQRYIDTVAKIPEIDTDVARETIQQQLLKEPRDYIRSCREVLANEGLRLEIEEIVTFGHHLSDYKRLVEEHGVDLLVMNTKDKDQLAMHGLAYSLSVEFRDIPLLLL